MIHARLAAALLLCACAPALAVDAKHLLIGIDARRADGDSVQLADLELLKDGVKVALPGAVVTADGQSPASETPPNALDDNPNTKWLQFGGAGTNITATLRIDLGAVVSFNGLRYRTANDAPGRDPISWRVLVSTDGTAWTQVSTVQGAVIPEARQAWTQVFTFTPKLKHFVVCPDSSIDWVAFALGRWDFGLPIPAEVESTRTKYGYWPCEGHKIQVQIYAPGEDAELLESDARTTAGLNAYIASKPLENITAKESAFRIAKGKELSDQFWPPAPPPPPPPAPTYKVSPNGAYPDRPLVKQVDGKAVSTPGRIAIGKLCDGTKRIGVTTYASVAGQISTTGAVLGDVYAVCGQVP